jgi:hypothetical protein
MRWSRHRVSRQVVFAGIGLVTRLLHAYVLSDKSAHRPHEIRIGANGVGGRLHSILAGDHGHELVLAIGRREPGALNHLKAMRADNLGLSRLTGAHGKKSADRSHCGLQFLRHAVPKLSARTVVAQLLANN